MMEAYFGGLDSAAQSFEPAVKSLARANLEVIGLCNRRTQAYLEVGSRLSRCRSPQDVMAEQVWFWRTMFSQYQESTQRIVALWAEAVPMPQFAQAPRQRDVLTLPEQEQVTGEVTSRRAAAA